MVFAIDPLAFLTALAHSVPLGSAPSHTHLISCLFLPLFMCFSFRLCLGTQEPGITMSSLGLRPPLISTVVHQGSLFPRLDPAESLLLVLKVVITQNTKPTLVGKCTG